MNLSEIISNPVGFLEVLASVIVVVFGIGACVGMFLLASEKKEGDEDGD